MVNKKLLFSLVFSFVSLISTAWINISIARAYLRADGKTRALFGLTELITYGFKYWVVIPGMIALILSLSSRRRSLFRSFCIAFAIVSIILVFVRLWKLLV
jgi:hypothetical protein